MDSPATWDSIGVYFKYWSSRENFNYECTFVGPSLLQGGVDSQFCSLRNEVGLWPARWNRIGSTYKLLLFWQSFAACELGLLG
jgi:hypothetical protein